MTPTPIALTDPASAAAHGLVLWVKLPPPATIDVAAPTLPDAWYDPAALFEEPERWDGLA